MPQPRRLTNEQEAAALAANRSGVQVAQLAKTYGLTWQGMRNCLDRAEARESTSNVPRGTLDAEGE